MNSVPRSLVLPLIAGLALNGCSNGEEPADQQAANASPEEVSTPDAASDTSSTATSGFDVNRVPVVNPQLGQFPFFSLIEGYQQSERGANSDVAFDRYEFFDGTKIIPVEGRLRTVEAHGQEASAFQVFKTYESLVTGLGGVTVFEGKAEEMEARGVEFSDMRHRHPVFNGDQMGVYMLRTPDREIWVEGYVKEYRGINEEYFLTIVEKKALEVRASLLPAEEMKRELDTQGHVALYINFDFDKADIRPESQPIIDEIVKLLENDPGLDLTVEGHTDNVGAPDYNKRLSDARARSVVAALTARGIEAGRLRAEGHGQDRPIADNSTDEGRAQNRRVELVKRE
jgi:outer membrane protein OmpA-like peptidoglycan-associated protein